MNLINPVYEASWIGLTWPSSRNSSLPIYRNNPTQQVGSVILNFDKDTKFRREFDNKDDERALKEKFNQL